MKFSKHRILLKFLLGFFAVLFICSVVQIGFYFWENWSTSQQLEEISELAEVVEVDETEQIITAVGQESEPVETDPYWQFLDTKLINVNFSELKQTNSDVVGWVQVSGTNINYPFTQTNNNQYYLNHSFDRSYNSAGWVFLDYRNNVSELLSEQNVILYAHGRLDQSMFGSLRETLKAYWQQDTSNYVVKISTEDTNSLWQIFSVYHLPTTSDYIQTEFLSEADYRSFLNLISERTIFDFQTSVTTSDHILTLSTCYNNDEKLVLHAKLLKYSSR